MYQSQIRNVRRRINEARQLVGIVSERDRSCQKPERGERDLGRLIIVEIASELECQTVVICGAGCEIDAGNGCYNERVKVFAKLDGEHLVVCERHRRAITK